MVNRRVEKGVKRGKSFEIEVDGGVKPENAR